MKKGLAYAIAALIGSAVGAGVTYFVMKEENKKVLERELQSEHDAVEMIYKLKYENDCSDIRVANKKLSEKVRELEEQIKCESPVEYAKKHNLIEKSSLDQEPPKSGWNIFDDPKIKEETAKRNRELGIVTSDEIRERRMKEMEKDADLAFTKYVGDTPYIISVEEWNLTPDDYGVATFYYTSDNFLVDEDRDVVDEAASLIGEGTLNMLKTYAAHEAYVRNDTIMMDYEILLIDDTLEELQAATY